eukprot:550748-Hanusia_phi.AAC.3
MTHPTLRPPFLSHCCPARSLLSFTERPGPDRGLSPARRPGAGQPLKAEAGTSRVNHHDLQP